VAVVPTPPPPPPAPAITDFVSGVKALDGTAAVQRSGSLPASNGGPTATQTSNSTVINGGSSQVRLTAGVPFQTVYASASGSAGTAAGFWELRLPAPASSATVVTSLGRSLPASGFNFVFTVVSTSGQIGPPLLIPVRVAAAGTGEVQVSASWDTPTDVDLHVVDPRGSEIFYGARSAASGGQLDLDSNPSCSIDNINNENIRWPNGGAPSGTYTVRLDYYSGCNVALTNYVVTVNNGGNTQTFTGSFTGAGDFGGAGSGRLITTFTHSGTSLIAPASAIERGLSPADLLSIAKKTAMSAARYKP
jgi:uncharacterized protein YfaP (DUF2135 family)